MSRFGAAILALACTLMVACSPDSPPSTLVPIPGGAAANVEVPSFSIERTEVTNRQFRACVAAGKCRDNRHQIPPAFSGDEQPVVMVTRADAEAYCTYAGRRLPAEWEWERAARGPQATAYVYGDGFKADSANTAYARPATEGRKVYRFTAPAASFPRDVSGFGVMDMGGNVSEWTSSTQGDGSPVVRGAGWYSERNQSAAGHREFVASAEITSLSIGFRCAQ